LAGDQRPGVRHRGEASEFRCGDSLLARWNRRDGQPGEPEMEAPRLRPF